MSKVWESGNDRRLEEVNQKRFREKVDTEKRDLDTRVQRSFESVMMEKSKRDLSERTVRDHNVAAQEQALRLPKQLLANQRPQEGAELARRAALLKAGQSTAEVQRKLDTETSRNMSVERREEILEIKDREVDTIDREARESDNRDGWRTEERFSEKNQPLDSQMVDPDGRGQGHKHQKPDQQAAGQKSRESEAIAGVAGPKGAAAPEIPREVIEQIVRSIHQAVSVDGKTSLRLELKGSTLEGVALTVTAQGGRVRCTFEGCDGNTKKLLEASREVLARGLSRRGLKLEALKVG